jgi:hypothetical protein
VGAAVLACAAPAMAQYPGRIDTNQSNGGVRLRATALLEYTGTLRHMTGSRLVPIAVWDGTEYQPGGLYLAQPAPLAVQGGTQYVLEHDGRLEGFYNIGSAAQIGGAWLGVGKFQAPPTETAKLEKPSTGDVYQVKYGNTSSNPNEPHFAHVPADDRTTDRTNDRAKDAPGTAEKDSGPTLHRRGAASSDGASGRVPQDSGRPTFGGDSENSTAPSPQTLYPGRPVLSYNTAKPKEKKQDALMGFPPGMKQAIAVSDASSIGTQSFGYTWANPEDAAKMKADLELAAERAIAASVPAPAPVPEEKSRTKTRRHGPAVRPVAPTAPVLEDEQFRVYGLTMGGGATLVLSAQTGLKDPRYGGKSVTIIAQPDFYGNPQILLTYVSSIDTPERTPRMELIGAVDTQGNGRGDLLFELRGQSYRRFAIYQVAGGQAARVFVTQPAIL